MTIGPRRATALLLIIGGGLAVIIAAGGLILWWLGSTADQRAVETAKSMCATKIRQAGGDPGPLRLLETLEANGTSVMLAFGGVTINGRAVICTADGFRPGGWASGVSLSYEDGTAVR